MPSAERGPAPGHAVPPEGGLIAADDAVLISGGKAIVGTNDPQHADDGEGPARRLTLAAFRIGATAVTNAAFHAFVEATGYTTEAEHFGWSFVFFDDVPAWVSAPEAVAAASWWRKVEGATWRAPHGPGTEAACRPDHPVVHVSWNDANAYARHVGGRLPSEAEWEHAARGGQGDVRFPWGDLEPNDTDITPCNIFQGRFPAENTAVDGYRATAPARSFAPNGFGLYNMVGNAWEWTADPFRIRSLKRSLKARQKAMAGYKVSKGGSYLCHKSYCYRYRIAARTGTSPDSTTAHQGFRIVWPAE